MVRLYWTDSAKEDLKNIATYISKDSFLYAEKQVERFYEATEVLYEHPKLGRPVPEYENESLRQILVGKYRVIYLIVDEGRIDIITVHHSAKLLDLEF